MCRYLDIGSGSNWDQQMPVMIAIFESVFGGPFGQKLRPRADLIPQLMLNNSIQPSSRDDVSFVSSLVQQAVLTFPLKMEPLLQLLSVLVGSEPRAAAAVLQQFANLQYFCGPHVVENQAVTMDAGADRSRAGGIAVQPFGGSCPNCQSSDCGICERCFGASESEHRNFILPKIRTGRRGLIDKRIDELGVSIWSGSSIAAVVWDRSEPMVPGGICS